MNKEQLLRAFRFLRITDDQNNLSLTNLALVAVLGRLMTLPGLETMDLLTFVATLVGYQVKRVVSGTSPSPATDTAELKAAMQVLETKISALQVGKVLNRPGK